MQVQHLDKILLSSKKGGEIIHMDDPTFPILIPKEQYIKSIRFATEEF